MVYLLEYYSDKTKKEYRPEYTIVNNIGELLNVLTESNKLTFEYYEYNDHIPNSVSRASQEDKLLLEDDFNYILKHNDYGNVGFNLFVVSIEELKLIPVTNLRINTKV